MQVAPAHETVIDRRVPDREDGSAELMSVPWIDWYRRCRLARIGLRADSHAGDRIAKSRLESAMKTTEFPLQGGGCLVVAQRLAR